MAAVRMVLMVVEVGDVVDLAVTTGILGGSELGGVGAAAAGVIALNRLKTSTVIIVSFEIPFIISSRRVESSRRVVKLS